jgi:hypothetical protein
MHNQICWVKRPLGYDLPKQTRGAASCLQGVLAGVPQISASLVCDTQNPSGPRQPEPPLQPQPLQRQTSSAKAERAPEMSEKQLKSRTKR